MNDGTRTGRTRRAGAIGALALVGMALIGAIAITPAQEAEPPGTLTRALQALDSMAEPGPLAAAHASLDSPDSCAECHTVREGVPDSACLVCHGIVGRRMDDHVGWHGNVEGHCLECHVEHEGVDHDLMPLDREAFNHERSVFRLEGAHRDLQCQQCHIDHASPENVGWQFLGLPQDCLGCHENPHTPEFAPDCQSCHVPTDWKDTHLFDHAAQTPFALAGAHRDLECAQCHGDDLTFAAHGLGGERVEAPFDCASCHENIHQDTALNDCQRCHTPAAWEPNAFDHGTMTDFPLVGAHRELECAQCHGEGDTFTPVGLSGHPIEAPFDCASCHENIHEDMALNDCQRCHMPVNWQPSTFDHETMTDFPLARLHAGISCDQCHGPTPAEEVQPRAFTVAGEDCASCHRDIEAIFSGARFADALGEERPEVHHGQITCDQCHSPADDGTRLSLIAPRCVACHTPAHGEQLFEEARLIEQSLAPMPRDAAGRIESGPFAGLRGSDLMHNAGAWLAVAGASSPEAR